MKFSVIPLWGQLAIGVAIIAIIFGTGWKVNGWRLNTKISKIEQKLEDAEAREEGWKRDQKQCVANAAKLEVALAEVAAKAEEIDDLTNRLQGAENITHRVASELAKARSEIAIVSNEYGALRAAAVNQSVCQTYESVLAALGGEGQ